MLLVKGAPPLPAAGATKLPTRPTHPTLQASTVAQVVRTTQQHDLAPRYHVPTVPAQHFLV